MVDEGLNRLEVFFALDDNERTTLVVQRNDHGCFDVSGNYQRLKGREYPSREKVEREGSIYEVTAEEISRNVRNICARGWYHHYRGNTTYSSTTSIGRWCIRLVYESGTELRWEGFAAAPVDIDMVYDTLVAFGMPALRLGYSGSYLITCGWSNPSSEVVVLDRLTCYEHLLDAAHGESGGEVDEAISLLYNELRDDIQLVLEDEGYLAGGKVLEEWGMRDDYEGLRTAPVQQASRKQMLALFEALRSLDLQQQVFEQAYTDGLLSRWWSRLRALPAEERIERRRRMEELHRQRMASIDDAVRHYLAEGDDFTSYEVAESCGVSAREASARIRGFVRNGLAQTVGDDYPRRYRAA